MWLLLLMPCPLIEPFIFRDLVYYYQLVDPDQVQYVGFILPCRSFRPLPWMLHRIVFCLSGKVVDLYLDNSTAKVYQCSQGGIVSPFLSRLACQILSLTDKHSIISSSSIHSYPSQCGGWLSVLGPDASRVASSPSGGSSRFSPLGSTRGWICWHPPIPLNASSV